MTDTNNAIIPVTDGLSMGMDSELVQLERIDDLTKQIKQNNVQMSKVLDTLEKANQLQ